MQRKYLFYIFVGLFIFIIVVYGLISFPTLILGGVMLTVLQKYSKNKEFPLYRTLFGIVFTILFLLIRLAAIL